MGQNVAWGPFIRYTLVGLLSTAIDYSVFMSTFNYLGILAATTISSSAAMLFSYFAHGLFTFKQHNPSLSNITAFMCSNIVSFWLVQSAIIFAVTSSTELRIGHVKILAFLCAIVLNFFLYRFIVWPQRDTPKN